MSFRCLIKLKAEAKQKDKPGVQVSPLQFPTAAEARRFAQALYEPPDSVESWDVEEVNEAPNCTYKDGQLRAR